MSKLCLPRLLACVAVLVLIACGMIESAPAGGVGERFESPSQHSGDLLSEQWLRGMRSQQVPAWRFGTAPEKHSENTVNTADIIKMLEYYGK